MTTPICPRCNSANTGPSGSARGKKQSKCKDCGKKFATIPGKAGRKMQGEQKKTAAQSSKDYYQRLTPAQRKALNKRKEDARKKKKQGGDC